MTLRKLCRRRFGGADQGQDDPFPRKPLRSDGRTRTPRPTCRSLGAMPSLVFSRRHHDHASLTLVPRCQDKGEPRGPASQEAEMTVLPLQLARGKLAALQPLFISGPRGSLLSGSIIEGEGHGLTGHIRKRLSHQITSATPRPPSPVFAKVRRHGQPSLQAMPGLALVRCSRLGNGASCGQTRRENSYAFDTCAT